MKNPKISLSTLAGLCWICASVAVGYHPTRCNNCAFAFQPLLSNIATRRRDSISQMHPTPSTLSGKTTSPFTFLHRQRYYPIDFSYQKVPPLVVLATASSQNDHEEDSSIDSKLDRVLTKLTSSFPLWVLSFAIGGLLQPQLLQWVNHGQLITIMLASVMVGTGLSLDAKDFTNILFGSNVVSVPLGVACQFLIMPFTAFVLGKTLLLPAAGAVSITGTTISVQAAKSLFLGLILVGCSPGGTASNLVSLIAQADVALSVILTACSTILASVVTPMLVKFLVGSTIAVSGKALVLATARVVLLPVLLGMIFQSKAPGLSKQISRFTPFGSVLLISFICGGVVAENSALLFSSKTLVPRLLTAVGLLHILGFGVGYLVPRKVFRRSETTARTVSIETGMQNSALAVVLARSMGADPLASLPGAISATAHSCLGSLLAAFWLLRPPLPVDKEDP